MLTKKEFEDYCAANGVTAEWIYLHNGARVELKLKDSPRPYMYGWVGPTPSDAYDQATGLAKCLVGNIPVHGH